MKLKVLVYDPYLAFIGGGSKFIFHLARILSTEDYISSIVIASSELPNFEALKLLGITPKEQLAGSGAVTMTQMGFYDFMEQSQNYDLVIRLTNQIPPPHQARNGLLIVQFPYQKLDASDSSLQLECLGYYDMATYSPYVAGFIQKFWQRDAEILPPPIELGTFSSAMKQQLIINVARFIKHDLDKRQDVLVKAYKALPEEVRRHWRLVLVGVAKEAQDFGYAEELINQSKGYSIDVRPNLPITELRRLYAKSQIYWHATGFGRSPSHPELAEHFGMGTIEAMSYGCVPVVYRDGAQKDIVKPDFGYTWETQAELIAATNKLTASEMLMNEMATQAHQASLYYGETVFKVTLRRIFKKLGYI